MTYIIEDLIPGKLYKLKAEVQFGNTVMDHMTYEDKYPVVAKNEIVLYVRESDIGVSIMHIFLFKNKQLALYNHGYSKEEFSNRELEVFELLN